MDTLNAKLNVASQGIPYATDSFIGTKIAQLRKKNGMKQEELGDLIGVTSQAVSKWEHGGVPDACLIPVIADVFNVTTDELFGRKENFMSLSEEDYYNLIYKYCGNRSKLLDSDSEANRALYFNILIKTAKVIFDGFFTSGKDGSDTLWENGEIPEDKFLNILECVSDEGSSIITANEDFNLLCAVRDSDGLSARLTGSNNVVEFLSEFGNSNFLKLIIFIQSSNQNMYTQYTIDYISNTLEIPFDETKILCEKLEKYSFLRGAEHFINNEKVVIYTVNRNPYFRPFYMLAYLMAEKGKIYTNQIANRSKPFI